MKIKFFLAVIFVFISFVGFASADCMERFYNPYVFAIDSGLDSIYDTSVDESCELNYFTQFDDVTVLNGDFWDTSPGEVTVIPGSNTKIMDLRNQSSNQSDEMLLRIIHNGVATTSDAEIRLQGHDPSGDGCKSHSSASRPAIAITENGQVITYMTSGTIPGIADYLLTVCPSIVNAYILDGGHVANYFSKANGCVPNACTAESDSEGSSLNDGRSGPRYYIAVTENPGRLPADAKPQRVLDRIFIPPTGTIGARYPILGNAYITEDLKDFSYDIFVFFRFFLKNLFFCD